MQHPDVPLQQRVRCIVEMFGERAANETAPLSRERIRQIIEQVVAEIDEERRREAQALRAQSTDAAPSLPGRLDAGGCNCS